MQPTRYETMAIEYYEKFTSVTKENEILNREITELKQSNYRLRDELHMRKQAEGERCLQKATV